MDLGLKDKTALVTGGGSGIGKAVCFLLAEEGAHVAVVDIHGEAAARVADTIRERQGKAIGITADVAKASDVDRMMARVLEEWGSVDILVNNAGIILQASAMAMTEQQWDKILGNNLKSCFLCSGQTLTVDGGYLMDGSLPGAEYWK